MPSLQTVLIWFLAVMLGGSVITGIALYVTRDTTRDSRRARHKHRREVDTLRRWQASATAARERAEARRPRPADPERLWQIIPPPGADYDHLTISERLRDWYLARERAATEAYLNAGAATWH